MSVVTSPHNATILQKVPGAATSFLHESTKTVPFNKNPQLSTLSLVPRGRALFWEGERQSQSIEIVEGVIRVVRLLKDGNRQIVAFYWPGDVVMPTRSSCQQFTAEAVTNCRVRLSNVTEICCSDEPCGARQMLSEMLALVVSMSQKTSVARVAEFLLRIRSHLPEDPRRPFVLQLLVPRADIADHVGTSLETVCRTLAEFRARKLIDLPNRKTIRFLNLNGLQRVAGD
jgi:CRP-like cAMP-binding protein